MKHCDTCTCETPAEREARIRQERDEIARRAFERDYAGRHSVLTDEDIAWARGQLAGGTR